MKLATYRDGSRDGQLVVVSRDLSQAHYANGVATRLQQVLDDWNFLSPQLEVLSQALNHGKTRHAFAFDPRMCMAPLPRACQWGVGMADAFVQRASDDLAGPCDEIVGGPTEFRGEVAAICDDVAMGASPEAAIDGVRLLMLALVAGADPRSPAAFSPVAATPDELQGSWRGGRVHLALGCTSADRQIDADFDVGAVIARLCANRRVRAGSIVGSGASIDARAQVGDRIGIDMKDAEGHSVFGAILQRFVSVNGPGAVADSNSPVPH